MSCAMEKNKLLWQNKCAPVSRQLPYSTEWYRHWMRAHGTSKGQGETQPLTWLYLLVYLTACLHHRHKLETRNRHSAVFALSHNLYSKTLLLHFCFTNTILPFDSHTDHVSFKKRDNKQTKLSNNKGENWTVHAWCPNVMIKFWASQVRPTVHLVCKKPLRQRLRSVNPCPCKQTLLLQLFLEIAHTHTIVRSSYDKQKMQAVMWTVVL